MCTIGNSATSANLAERHGLGKWIRFDELTPCAATKRWAVVPTNGSGQVGVVKWYGPWRKYCFFPMIETVFEQVCLRDIANFCENETVLHRLDRQHKLRLDAILASEKITEEDMCAGGVIVKIEAEARALTPPLPHTGHGSPPSH